MSPLLSHVYELGLIEAEARTQREPEEQIRAAVAALPSV
jgi:hypothetical protein